MSEKLSNDSLAIVLLCTSLALPSTSGNPLKPLTPSEWERASEKLQRQQLRPSVFFEQASSIWQDVLGVDKDFVERIQRLLARSAQLAFELERLDSLGIWVKTRAEPDYPVQWKRRLRQKSPVVVYGAGNPKLLGDGNERVAIVGSRRADDEALRFTENLAAQCAEEDMCVVSGGASGVDMTAQTTALDVGGTVISVVSEGLEGTIKKRNMRKAILSGHLLMLSSVAPRMRFTAHNAMARNKYVYTLSHYSVVVASALKGGTWSGAVENLRHHWIPLFVRDTERLPEGNQPLILQGGIPFPEGELDARTMQLSEWFRSHEKERNVPLEEPRTNHVDMTDQAVADIFPVVWPIMKETLSSPQSVSDLAEYLNVIEPQVFKWVERAMQSGHVRKLPQSELFVNSDYSSVRQMSFSDTES